MFTLLFCVVCLLSGNRGGGGGREPSLRVGSLGGARELSSPAAGGGWGYMLWARGIVLLEYLFADALHARVTCYSSNHIGIRCDASWCIMLAPYIVLCTIPAALDHGSLLEGMPSYCMTMPVLTITGDGPICDLVAPPAQRKISQAPPMYYTHIAAWDRGVFTLWSKCSTSNPWLPRCTWHVLHLALHDTPERCAKQHHLPHYA